MEDGPKDGASFGRSGRLDRVYQPKSVKGASHTYAQLTF